MTSASRRSTVITRYPSAVSRRAVAAPMPDVAPVIAIVRVGIVVVTIGSPGSVRQGPQALAGGCLAGIVATPPSAADPGA